MHLHPEALFLVQAVILIGAPILLWQLRLVRSIAPLVVIQVILGICLGPTVLGRFFPELYEGLFPKDSLAVLSGIAWLGLSFFGFLTGLHFELKSVAKRGYAFALTSVSTLIVPILFGAVLALSFYREPFVDANTDMWLFVAGVACAVGVTALPVLSAILIELKLIGTQLGRRVLGYAAVNDIGLWVAVACLTIIASSRDSDDSRALSIVLTILLALGFIVAMYVLVRKICAHLARKGLLTAKPSLTQFAMVSIGVLISALATELIGIHYVFGAFVFGAMMPEEIRSGLYKSFEEFTMVALMPFYFMLTGLKTSFSFENTAAVQLFVAATVVAVLGKVIGTAVPEYICMRSTPKVALKAGVLMQTKGLMEIVVLNILLAHGIINTTVFSALVLMAVATTFLTKPSILLASRIAGSLSARTSAQRA